METRRIERCFKDTLCVRFAGEVWICLADQTGFKLGERPYVILSGNGTVIVRRVNGRLRETWKHMTPLRQMSYVEQIAKITEQASRVDGSPYKRTDVELIQRPTYLREDAWESWSGWSREARIGKHTTGPRHGTEEQVLGALLGILGSMPSASRS